MKYMTVIGLEIHSELLTKTKAFCSCKNKFGGAPNTNCCEVCTGQPGALPTVNAKAVEYTIKAGLAFNCKINNEAVYERKNYYYPDLSKAYQISQLEKPLCLGGAVNIELNDNFKAVKLNRIHMEEDAGKNIHDEYSGISMVDYNRCGVPLIEIVTEPDIFSGDEAVAVLTSIKETLVYLGISDGKMQEGSLRCDVNVSLKPEGATKLGNRTEMKNLNSFKAVKRAIEYEVKRQESLLNNGESIHQETRRWDDNLGESFSMRTKESSQDYRYFPDPDLLPIVVEESYVKQIKASMPELGFNRRKRYINELKLPKYDATVLTNSKNISDYFEECLKIYNKPKAVSNFIMSNVLRKLKEELNLENAEILLAPKHLCAIIATAKKGEINSGVAKEVFDKCWGTNKNPLELIEELGLKQDNNEETIKELVNEIIKNNPQAVADYNLGNKKAITFFMGQVMKATKGSANPQIVNKLILENLNK